MIWLTSHIRPIVGWSWKPRSNERRGRQRRESRRRCRTKWGEVDGAGQGEEAAKGEVDVDCLVRGRGIVSMIGGRSISSLIGGGSLAIKKRSVFAEWHFTKKRSDGSAGSGIWRKREYPGGPWGSVRAASERGCGRLLFIFFLVVEIVEKI